MKLSKRAWENPFDFLPVHNQPPKGYKEIQDQEDLVKKIPIDKTLPPHLPITVGEYDSLYHAEAAMENQNTELSDVVSKFIQENPNFTDKKGTFAYIPLRSTSGVSASKAIRAIQGVIRKRLHNLKNSKNINLSKFQVYRKKSHINNLKQALENTEKIYQRLVSMSKRPIYRYDQDPQFTSPKLSIGWEEASILDRKARDAGLEAPITSNEDVEYEIPRTMEIGNQKFKINKYLQKFRRAFPDYTVVDSLIDRLRFLRKEIEDSGGEHHPDAETYEMEEAEARKFLKMMEKFNLENHFPPIKNGIMRIPIRYEKVLVDMNKSYDFPNYFEALQERISAKASPLKWNLVVSAEPQDLLTMSTNRGWTSCVAKGQCNYKSLDSAVSNFDMIAYAVSPTHSDWLARVWLRNDGDNKWWPEAQVYGAGIIAENDFLNAVNNYLKSKNILGKKGKYHPDAFGYSDLLQDYISLYKQPKEEKEQQKTNPYDELEYLPQGKMNIPISDPEILIAVPENEFKMFLKNHQLEKYFGATIMPPIKHPKTQKIMWVFKAPARLLNKIPGQKVSQIEVAKLLLNYDVQKRRELSNFLEQQNIPFKLGKTILSIPKQNQPMVINFLNQINFPSDAYVSSIAVKFPDGSVGF